MERLKLFKSEKRSEMFQQVVDDMFENPPKSARLIRLSEIVANEAVEAVKQKIEEHGKLSSKT